MADYVVQDGDTLWSIWRDRVPHGPDDSFESWRASIGYANTSTLRPGDTISLDGGGVQAGQPRTDFTDDELTRFKGLPGQPELWKDTTTNKIFVTYFAPGEPPIPLLFQLTTNEEVEALGGGQGGPGWDRSMSAEEIASTGAIHWGVRSQIPETEGDPWEGFVEEMSRAAETQPWLADPEVYAVYSAARLTGRPVSRSDLEATEWWQSHNEAQQDWLWLEMRAPQDAIRRRQDNRVYVHNLFRQVGVNDPDQSMVDYLAEEFTQGNWTDTKLKDQVFAVTGLPSSGPVDGSFAEFLTRGGVSPMQAPRPEEAVRQQFHRWLGGGFPPDSDQLRSWAVRLRDEGQAGEDALTEYLRGQRLATWQEYKDPGLTYQDIANPWRSFISQRWGQRLDDTDEVLDQVIRLNDGTEAAKYLRREGLARGVKQVRDDADSQLYRAVGSNVRRAV